MTLDVVEIQAAEKQIIKLHQKRYFHSEIKAFTTDQSKLNRSSAVAKLDPFIDNDGLLKVGGRLRRAQHVNEVHPVLISKFGLLSRVIITWCHENVGHGGRGFTLNELRSCGFWITNANTLVRSIINKCVCCRRLRGKTGEQKMADLPSDRTMEHPPFTYCGVDVFGPFIIKNRRKEY